MRLTTQACDAWTATMHRRLDAIQAAIMDTIDVGTEPSRPSGHIADPGRDGRCKVCGTDAVRHERRPPTGRERISQDRTDGHFRPTPQGQNRVPYHVSNPVHAATERWETQVEEAVTSLYGTVGELVSIVDQLGLQPYDGEGEPLVCPVEPPTRRTATGRLVIELHPSRCRNATLRAVSWLGAACDVLIDRARSAGSSRPAENTGMSFGEGESGELIADRCRYIEQLTGMLARRVGVHEPRTCNTGCGRPAPRGDGETCPACRKAKSRSSVTTLRPVIRTPERMSRK